MRIQQDLDFKVLNKVILLFPLPQHSQPNSFLADFCSWVLVPCPLSLGRWGERQVIRSGRNHALTSFDGKEILISPFLEIIVRILLLPLLSQLMEHNENEVLQLRSGVDYV